MVSTASIYNLPFKIFCWRYREFWGLFTPQNFTAIIRRNQSRFILKNQTSDEFKFISGTKGQVWSLFEQEERFCGHDSGTFVIENAVAKNIFYFLRNVEIWDRSNQRGLLLQGNYYGLSVLSKINNQWTFRNKIAGFDYSSKYFEIMNNLNVCKSWIQRFIDLTIN
jgi:hypothetical protein